MAKKKVAVQDVAKGGARTAGHIAMTVLKVIGTIILMMITTCLVFACIFTIYCKSNFSSGLDVDYDDFAMSLSSVIYAKNKDTGEYEELVTISSSEYRMWVDYEDIPVDMEHAVVAIEDRNFYKHHGVDWYRTAGAFVNMFLNMSDTFGGSTITQQLIKNLTDDDEVTVQRKLLEIFRALDFEKKHDKWEIIELYLNLVYFGHGCYGVGAAAQYYFGKDVSELTLAEIACIIGITNNPSLYSPYIYPENNKRRQEIILNEMYEQGYISLEQRDEAIAQELVLDTGDDEEGDDSSSLYTWFEEAVRDDVIETLAEIRNCSEETAELLLMTGGYQIYSTIDLDVQKAIDTIYENLDEIPSVWGSSQQVQSAIVIVDPYTGDIVGMAGGVGEKTVDLGMNRATDSTRPPGSAFKPIASYGPALEYGLITPNTRMEDSKDLTLSGTTWMPNNVDFSYRGVVTVRQAMMLSLNTVAATIVDMLTPQVSYEFVTEKAGLTTLVPEDADYAAMALGQLTYGATVRDMASAYTMFVNKGVRSTGRTFTHIYDSDWNLVYENKTEQVAAISEKTAYWMTDMMQTNVDYEVEPDIYGMPTAGKTGTSEERWDRWFVGYTPYYVAAVWTGYDMPTMMSCYGNPSSQLFKKVMTLVHENLEYRDFNVPEDTYLTPVPGVEEVSYTVRGVDEDKNVIYEETYSGIAGRTAEVKAPTIEGYTLVSTESTVSIVIGDTTEVEFVYKSDTPKEPEEPEEPEEPVPEPEPDPDPGTDPPKPEGGT